MYRRLEWRYNVGLKIESMLAPPTKRAAQNGTGRNRSQAVAMPACLRLASLKAPYTAAGTPKNSKNRFSKIPKTQASSPTHKNIAPMIFPLLSVADWVGFLASLGFTVLAGFISWLRIFSSIIM